MLIDDSSSASSPEECIREAKRLSGILSTLITEEIQQEIIDMKAGDKLRIRKPSLKYTLNIKRVR